MDCSVTDHCSLVARPYLRPVPPAASYAEEREGISERSRKTGVIYSSKKRIDGPKQHVSRLMVGFPRYSQGIGMHDYIGAGRRVKPYTSALDFWIEEDVIEENKIEMRASGRRPASIRDEDAFVLRNPLCGLGTKVLFKRSAMYRRTVRRSK